MNPDINLQLYKIAAAHYLVLIRVLRLHPNQWGVSTRDMAIFHLRNIEIISERFVQYGTATRTHANIIIQMTAQTRSEIGSGRNLKNAPSLIKRLQAHRRTLLAHIATYTTPP